MATFAESLLPALEAARGIAGGLGLHPHSVTVSSGTYSGSETGAGTETTSDTTILESGQNPKVEWLNDEQLAMGNDASGTVRIGPLTPTHHLGGGIELATLAGTALSTGQTIFLTITGPKHPSGTRYRITRIDAQSALHYTLRALPA